MKTDKQLEILHDHYKETFTRIRETEALRDRLFLWLIGLFALLSLEIGYPAAVGAALGKLSLFGGELNLQALPLPALLNATWVLTLAIALRYCQVTVFVIRQYPYLHLLEQEISPELGGSELVYQREGKFYADNYPLVLDVVWIAYSLVFPLIMIVAAFGLAYWEVTQVPYPFWHKLFDALIAACLISLFLIYRIQPTIANQWRKWRLRRHTQKNQDR